MPYSSIRHLTKDDAEGHFNATGVYTTYAVELYETMKQSKEYPKNFLNRHHSGVRNLQVLSIFIGCGKASYQIARAALPDDEVSLQAAILLKQWHALNNLSIILRRDAPKHRPLKRVRLEPDAKFVEENGAKTLVVRVKLEGKDMHSSSLTEDFETLARQGGYVRVTPSLHGEAVTESRKAGGRLRKCFRAAVKVLKAAVRCNAREEGEELNEKM